MTLKKEIEETRNKLWLLLPSVTEEVNEFEIRGDGRDYTPNENERYMIEEWGHGFIEECINKIADKYNLKERTYDTKERDRRE